MEREHRSPSKTGLFRRPPTAAVWLFAVFAIIISFQNFSFHSSSRNPAAPPIDPSLRRLLPTNAPLGSASDGQVSEPGESELRLLPTHLPHQSNSSETDQAEFDIRDSAPHRPDRFEQFAPDQQRPQWEAPAQVSSAAGAGTSWAEREMRPLLAPYEQKWVASVNRRLDRMFRFTPVKGEAWPDSGDEEAQRHQPGPAGAEDDEGDGQRYPASPGIPGLPATPPGSADLFSWRSFQPRDLRMTKANELTLGFSAGSNLSYQVDARQSVIRYTRPVTSTTSVNLSHETAEKRNSLNLNIAW